MAIIGLGIVACMWIFIFFFEDASEMELVLKKSPWKFDNCLIAKETLITNYMLSITLLYVGTDVVENVVIIAIENDFVDAIGKRTKQRCY